MAYDQQLADALREIAELRKERERCAGLLAWAKAAKAGRMTPPTPDDIILNLEA